MPVDASKRAAFIEMVQSKKEWETKVFTGNSFLGEGPVRIPFAKGQRMLTWATGGGVPMGHFGRWYGEEGSGKSLTNLGLIYSAQNFTEISSVDYEREIKFYEARGNKIMAAKLKQRLKSIIQRFPDNLSVCLYDTEQRFEFKFAEQLGIRTKNKDELILMDENIIENIIEQMKDAVSAYHVVIVDSVSNAESFAEAMLEPGQYERGTAAAAWKRLRQVRRKLDRSENVILFVDQVRSQLGQTQFKGGKQETMVAPPNIRFLKHNVSLALAYSQGKKLYLDSNGLLTDDYKKASDDFAALGSQGKEVAGLEMRCKVEKNSTGKPFRNAAMRFRFPVRDVRTGELVQEIGFDSPYELLMVAEHFHIIESSGGGRFYLLDDKFKRVKIGKSKKDVGWHGAPATREAIEADDELRERILTRLRMDT